jgi:hypothetical protein
MTFDRMSDLGLSGDRKPEDYHLVQFEKHREIPGSNYLPVFNIPLLEICYSTGFYNFLGDKAVKERAKVDKLKESIKINGLVRPLLLTKKNNKWYLREGGHRYLALKELGINVVAVRDSSNLSKAGVRDDLRECQSS